VSTQRPPLQASAVHGLPSWHSVDALQARQSGVGVWMQPVSGRQESAVQGSSSPQTSGVPALHAPARQRSVPSHRSPSAQLVPSATGV
jgi:hypothetical protein